MTYPTYNHHLCRIIICRHILSVLPDTMRIDFHLMTLFHFANLLISKLCLSLKSLTYHMMANGSTDYGISIITIIRIIKRPPRWSSPIIRCLMLTILTSVYQILWILPWCQCGQSFLMWSIWPFTSKLNYMRRQEKALQCPEPTLPQNFPPDIASSNRECNSINF